LSNFLSDISVTREKILALRILPQREIGLRKIARLRTIYSSTAIEGKKKQAINRFIQTVGIFGVITVVVWTLLALGLI
jgi:hypothetical protein